MLHVLKFNCVIQGNSESVGGFAITKYMITDPGMFHGWYWKTWINCLKYSKGSMNETFGWQKRKHPANILIPITR